MEDGNVFLTLNDNQSLQDGEEMVVIADDNLDINTLQNLLASGAVQTVNNDDEIIHVSDANLLGDTIVQVDGENYQVITDENGTTYLAPVGQSNLNTSNISNSVTDNSGITYRCPSCPQSYQNANAFTKHMREKHFVKVYTCRQCEQFYETLSQLFLHARRTHVDPKKPKKNPGNYKFHCPDCNYMTNNGGTMEHHRRAHTGVKPFSCDICGKHFAQKANMKTHKNRHIHKDRIFRCETCGKAFNSYDIYLAHLRTREHELREHFQMIASSKLVLGCMGCNNTFDSMFNLNKHTRSCAILKQMDTKFCCKSCESYFTDIMTLKSHVKSHEGNQIISCPVCGERGFPGFNQLNHHITRAHALKVNRRHVCRYCESTFESKKDLDTHISDMHSEERNARQSRGAVGRLRCRYTNCDFTSNSVMLMDRHHRQHTVQGTDGNYALTLPQSRYSKYGKRRKIREIRTPVTKQDDYDEDNDLLEEEIERVNASLEANEILRYPTILDEDDEEEEDEEEDDEERMRRINVDEDDEMSSDRRISSNSRINMNSKVEIDDMQQLADSIDISAVDLVPVNPKDHPMDSSVKVEKTNRPGRKPGSKNRTHYQSFDASLSQTFNDDSSATTGRARKKPWWYKDYDTTDALLSTAESIMENAPNNLQDSPDESRHEAGGASSFYKSTKYEDDDPDNIVAAALENEEWNIDM